MKLSLDFDTFNGQTFVANMAMLLSIPLWRIKIVSVRRGSTIIESSFVPNNATEAPSAMPVTVVPTFLPTTASPSASPTVMPTPLPGDPTATPTTAMPTVMPTSYAPTASPTNVTEVTIDATSILENQMADLAQISSNIQAAIANG